MPDLEEKTQENETPGIEDQSTEEKQSQDNEQIEEAAPENLKQRLEDRLELIEDMLRIHEQLCLKKTFEGNIAINYYNDWVADARKEFTLCVNLKKRLDNLEE